MIAKFRSKNEQALFVVGRQAAGFIKEITPVKFGNLRASIVAATSKQAETPGKVSGGDALPGVKLESPDEGHVVIGTNVHYAPHIEYGTVKTKAQPFLRPGVLNNKAALGSTYAKMMKGL